MLKPLPMALVFAAWILGGCGANHPQNLLRQGIEAEQEGKLADARRLYEQVLKKDPNDLEALERQGLLLIRLQEPAQAEAPLSRAALLAPERLTSIVPLAELRLRERQTQAAEDLIAPWKAGSSAPEPIAFLRAAVALQKNDKASARRILEQLSREGSRRAQVRLAGLDMAEGKWSDAEKKLQTAIAADGNDLSARIGLGVAALAQGNVGKAKESFDSAWKDPSKPSAAAAGLILCAVRDGDLKRATDIAGELASANPGEINGAVLLAELAVAANQPDALASIDLPETAGSIKQYVDGLKHFSNQQYFDAYPLLTSVAKEWTEYGPAQLYAGRVAQNLNDRAQALDFFTRAEGRLPANPELNTLIVQAALAQSNSELALKQLATLPQDDPTLQSIRVESAFSRGDFTAALAEAERWKAASPDSPWARLAVADVQYMIGRRAEASAIWKEIAASGSGAARSWAAFRTSLAAQDWNGAGEALESMGDGSDRSSISILKGQMQLLSGDIDRARASFEEAVRDGPQNASAYAWLGLCHAVQRQFTIALDHFKKALSLNASDPVALWGQGFIAFLDKAYPEAADYFGQSVRAMPGFDLSRFFLAETLMGQGRPGEAVAQLDRLSPMMQETAPVLDLRGRALILERRWSEALENWQMFQKKYPKSAASYFYIAQIHFIQGRKDPARESVEAGLKIAPDDLRLRIARADLLWQAGKRDEALLVATQTAKDRKNLDASIAQAAMHLGQGHFSKASSTLKELLAANPDDPRLYALLYEAQMGLAKEEEAILTLRTGWLRAPKALGLGLKLAAIQESRRNWPEAISTYREILKTQPDHRRALNQLAWLLAQQETDLDEALQLSERACKLDLGNVAALDTRAWILYLQQKFPEARKELEQLIRAAPDQPYVRYHWGLVLWKTGDAPGAKAVLSKLVQEQPKFAEIDKAKEALSKI